MNTINEDSAVSTTTGVMNLNTVVTKILNDYVPSKKETFAGHQMGSFFRSDIPLAIYETGIVESAPYLITGSVGQGNWAMIPWVCIFDRKITTTATKGIYIVYLLSKDGNSLYLSFNQGCTDIRKNNSKKDTIRIMREKAEDIRKRIDSRGFNADNNAKLGDGLTELGELYQEGMIFYKEYKKGNVPGESELQNDLRLMMDIYKEYVNGKAGEVTKTSAVKRRDIREIPKNSDEAYYRFEIKEWKELNIPLVAKEVRDFPFFTNMFLLQHCPDVPDLHISSEEEYRLYIEVRRLANDASVNETDAEPGFKYDDKTIIMENGDIVVLKDGTKIEQISIETFMRKPRESMRVIAK